MKFVKRYLTNRLWEFHQIYHFCAAGDTDKPMRVSGQKVKGQGHSEIIYVVK